MLKEMYSDISSNQVIKKRCVMKTSGLAYDVLKYDEHYVCEDDEETGKYRSVVFSDTGKLLCYSPPKSIPEAIFAERIRSQEAIETTEVIEGVMISLFWDDRLPGWELATKGAIGGNYWFFRTQYEASAEKTTQKTFRKMCLEAFRAEGGQDVNDLVWLKELPHSMNDARFCYNFVLQHPDNHIVLDIDIPKIYLVSVYQINENSNEPVFVSPKIYREWEVFYGVNTMVEFPRMVETDDMPWSLPGHMRLNTETGDRICIENPIYNEIKMLRGNNPNLHYHYLCLLKIGKIENFLEYFPRYKKVFSIFYKQFETFITHAHQYYVSYFIKKERRQIPKKYFLLIQRLQKEVFVPSLKTEKIIMKRPVVRTSFLDLTPQEMFFYLHP
jgi:hypothetical protein